MADHDPPRTADAPAKGDCYSAGERQWMEYGQQLRGRWLVPLLRRLDRLCIRPDHLTIVSLLFGLAFVPLWFCRFEWLAVLSLLMHVALDGLDGPLARFQNVASPRGSFTDSFCHQLVVSAVTISLMMISPARLSVVLHRLFLSHATILSEASLDKKCPPIPCLAGYRFQFQFS